MDIIEDAQRIMRSYGDIPASELARKLLTEKGFMDKTEREATLEIALQPDKMTWQQVIEQIDRYIAELREMMDTHPQYGVVIQQRMAVMLFKRMQAVEQAEREK